MKNSDEQPFKSLGAEFAIALDTLSRMECPECYSGTLEIEMTVRSGVRFYCRGWKMGTDDHICDFQYLVRATSRADLPDINQKVKVQTK